MRTFGACSVGGVGRQFRRSGRSRFRVFDGEELPCVGDTFKGMGAAISESHPRASDEVGDGPRDEDFVGFGVRLYALGDVDGDAADVATAQLDLTRVQPTRTWMPIARTASQMAQAQRTARPGPSKAAKNPSPVIWISRPRKRSSSARVRPSWVTNSSDHLRSPMPATWSAARSQPQAGPICQNDAREDVLTFPRAHRFSNRRQQAARAFSPKLSCQHSVRLRGRPSELLGAFVECPQCEVKVTVVDAEPARSDG